MDVVSNVLFNITKKKPQYPSFTYAQVVDLKGALLKIHEITARSDPAWSVCFFLYPIRKQRD